MSRHQGKTNDIADDVYCQFVRSLFANEHILIVGGITYVAIALMVYVKTSVTAFLMIAPILLAANVWRYAGIRAFHRKGGVANGIEDARRWEQDYIIRGCAQGLAVGAFCFLSIYLYPSAYAEVASVAMSIASLITVASRNYGSPNMVRILSLSFTAPAALAFLLRGELAYALLGLMLVPLMLITVSSAGYVRQVLFAAVIGQKRADQLAQRFDRALNTMPQGLLMFDKQGRVIVANAEAAHIVGIDSPAVLTGRSISALMRRIVAAGLMDKQQSDKAMQRLIRALQDGSDRKLVVALQDGRSFEFTTREGDKDLGVVMFEDVTQRVRASERIVTMARFDGLTSLPNRAYMHELIVERLAVGDRNRHCALAIFDLDDFKGVNDSLGHPTGDELIKAIAKRLGRFASENVIVGRFGGDEFVVFCNDVADRESFGSLLDAVRETLSTPSEVFGTRIALESSGGAVLVQVASTDVDTMIVRADLALHAAKAHGKNGWMLFEESMEQSFRLRERLKADLRNAIVDRSLRVVYQPILQVKTMKMVTCEALCRWDHPELGQVSPSVFVPLAEETGIIQDITSFVLEQACADCVRWPGRIGVSVNLSARDLSDGGIVEKVAGILASTGLPPNRLEVEMTETSLLDDKSAARTYVEAIRRLGVRIALDDFGTGYSSLSYMHRLPVDKIKIDRSFLVDTAEDRRSRELIKSVVQLSQKLGMTVTVEGVETFEQLNFLADEVHPDTVQGFLFGSALTASGIETMSLTAWQFPSGSATAAARTPSRHHTGSEYPGQQLAHSRVKLNK